jgi:group I intron endonuclease
MINNMTIIPIKSYSNLYENRKLIFKENRNKSGIYRFNNLINKKSYIGSSINLSKRFNVYFSKKAMFNKLKISKSIIYKALLKYNHDNFNLEIIEYCEENILIEREQYYLDNFQPKYNILKVAKNRLRSKYL